LSFGYTYDKIIIFYEKLKPSYIKIRCRSLEILKISLNSDIVSCLQTNHSEVEIYHSSIIVDRRNVCYLGWREVFVPVPRNLWCWTLGMSQKVSDRFIARLPVGRINLFRGNLQNMIKVYVYTNGLF